MALGEHVRVGVQDAIGQDTDLTATRCAGEAGLVVAHIRLVLEHRATSDAAYGHVEEGIRVVVSKQAGHAIRHAARTSAVTSERGARGLIP